MINEMMSFEELDKVAGGTHNENREILTEMGYLDRKGLFDVLGTWTGSEPDAKYRLATAMTQLIHKNFSDKGYDVYARLDPNDGAGHGNIYFIDGKNVSHKTFISFLHGCWSGDDF